MSDDGAEILSVVAEDTDARQRLDAVQPRGDLGALEHDIQIVAAVIRQRTINMCFEHE